jgi:hypothetical protein
MTEYEARIVMGLGLPDEVIAIECLDDEAAVEAAEMLVDSHDVELWRGPVKLGTLHHYMRTLPDQADPVSNVVSFRRALSQSK